MFCYGILFSLGVGPINLVLKCLHFPYLKYGDLGASLSFGDRAVTTFQETFN